MAQSYTAADADDAKPIAQAATAAFKMSFIDSPCRTRAHDSVDTRRGSETSYPKFVTSGFIAQRVESRAASASLSTTFMRVFGLEGVHHTGHHRRSQSCEASPCDMTSATWSRDLEQSALFGFVVHRGYNIPRWSEVLMSG